MKAMILAAGRGERMRPLTDATPKPLLPVGGKPLVAWLLHRLAAAGIRDVVVNTAYRGEQLEDCLGDGGEWGVRIAWSRERSALETAGGVARALPLLGRAPFILVSGDLFTDYDFASLHDVAGAIARAPDRRAAHFVLVDNPVWHAEGDMGLYEGVIRREAPRLTYANIGVFHPALFSSVAPGTRLALFPWAYQFVDAGRVTGERFGGRWENVGTMAQLKALGSSLGRSVGAPSSR